MASSVESLKELYIKHHFPLLPASNDDLIERPLNHEELYWPPPPPDARAIKAGSTDATFAVKKACMKNNSS